MNYLRTLPFDELRPYPAIRRTTPVSCHSMNYPRILPFDELPPYPVRSFSYRNEQVRADQIQRGIVQSTISRSPCLLLLYGLLNYAFVKSGFNSAEAYVDSRPGTCCITNISSSDLIQAISSHSYGQTEKPRRNTIRKTMTQKRFEPGKM
jgi:hypothetical protein